MLLFVLEFVMIVLLLSDGKQCCYSVDGAATFIGRFVTIQRVIVYCFERRNRYCYNVDVATTFIGRFFEPRV